MDVLNTTTCVPVRACRGCGASKLDPIIALGPTPIASYLPVDERESVPTYPLDLVRCPACSLVQLGQIVSSQPASTDRISPSDTLLRHAEAVADELVTLESLDGDSLVMEIASTEGGPLACFKRRGVPVLSVEPELLDSEGQRADVILGNDALAQVPDLVRFLKGVAALLKTNGLAQFELAYLGDMLDNVEFDEICHKHQCYFSITALRRAVAEAGLELWDVRRLPIQGRSLRLRVCRAGARQSTEAIARLLAEEASWGVGHNRRYNEFAKAIAKIKSGLIDTVEWLRVGGARVAAYGAGSQGVTLLSHCGIGRDNLEFVVDGSSYKQTRRFPIDYLPILPPSALLERLPGYALLLTSNLADEILSLESRYRAAGGKFIIPIPTPRVV